MQVTATDAKNRFGQICAAKREPVFVEKAGRVDTVILSLSSFKRCKRSPNLSPWPSGRRNSTKPTRNGSQSNMPGLRRWESLAKSFGPGNRHGAV